MAAARRAGLVELNVGGTPFTTTVETLTQRVREQEGRGEGRSRGGAEEEGAAKPRIGRAGRGARPRALPPLSPASPPA